MDEKHAIPLEPEGRVAIASGGSADKAEKAGFPVVEKSLQILSITFVLTYISGYLVTSTFLSSYGIAADASEFLKARYLFVGFLYLLFLASVGMAFGFFAVFYDRVRARARWAKRHPIKLKKTPRELKRRYIAVWTAAGFFFASSEAIQIMFLSLNTFRDFILLQTGLLASFLFYQVTNARALHHPGWDRHRSIFQMRGWTVLAVVIFAGLPITFLFFPHEPGRLADFVNRNKGWAVAIFNPLLFFAFCRALPFFYTGESLKKRTRFMEPKQKLWEGIGPIRTLLGAAIIFAPANFILLAPYKWRWIGLQWVNLFLSAFALASIIFMSIAYTRDRKINKQKLTNSEDWSIWLLRIATSGTLYVASTIGYANVIYPLVPFAKSGGDFTTASVVRVHFHYSEISELIGRESSLERSSKSQDSPTYLPHSPVPRPPDSSPSLGGIQPKAEFEDAARLYPTATSCEPGISTTCEGLVILEESPDVVYFARLDDATSLIDGSRGNSACGPQLWKFGLLDRLGPYRPHLISVSRRNIVSIEETGVVSETKNCR